MNDKTPTFLEWLQERGLEIEMFTADDELFAQVPLRIRGSVTSIMCFIRMPATRNHCESFKRRLVETIRDLERHMARRQRQKRLMYDGNPMDRPSLIEPWVMSTPEEVAENLGKFIY